VQLVWVVGLALDVADQEIATRRVHAHASFFARSSWFYVVPLTLRIACLFVDDPSHTARPLYVAHIATLSVYAIIIALGVLPILSRMSRPFGVLVLAIEQMLVAVSQYIVFTMVLYLAMTLGMLGLTNSGLYSPAIQPKSKFSEVGAFGDTVRHPAYLMPAFAYMAPTFAPLADFDGFSAQVIILIYLFFTSKVLVSLIMAIFTSAHSRVFKNSELEYTFSSHLALFAYQHAIDPLPPPINLPIVLFNFTRYYCRVLRYYVSYNVHGTAPVYQSWQAHKIGQAKGEKVSVSVFVQRFLKAVETQRQKTTDVIVGDVQRELRILASRAATRDEELAEIKGHLLSIREVMEGGGQSQPFGRTTSSSHSSMRTEPSLGRGTCGLTTAEPSVSRHCRTESSLSTFSGADEQLHENPARPSVLRSWRSNPGVLPDGDQGGSADQANDVRVESRLGPQALSEADDLSA